MDVRHTLGIAIDPTESVSGSRVAVGAAKTMETGMNRSAKSIDRAFASMRKTTEANNKSLQELEKSGKRAGTGLDATSKKAKATAASVSSLKRSLRGTGTAFNAVGDAVGLLSPRLGQLIGNAQRAGATLKNLGTSFGGIGGKASGASGSVGGFVTKVGLVGAVVGTAVAGIAALGAAYVALRVAAKAATVAIDLIGKSIQLAADAASTGISFEVLIGDATKAATVIKELKELANETPLDTKEVVNAGQQLIAFGTKVEDVTDQVRMLGDVSSAFDSLSLKELSDIFGKIQTQGRVQGEDINQLAGRGIPIYKELGLVMGVAASEVRNLVTEGKVGFPQIEAAFKNMTGAGGPFEDMMKRQATTFNGLKSTLIAGWNEVLTIFGEPIQDGIRPLLETAIDRVKQLQSETTGVLPEISKITEVIAGTLRVALTDDAGFKAALDAIGSALELILKNVMIEVGNTLETALLKAGRSFGNQIKNAFSGEGLFDNAVNSLKSKLRAVNKDFTSGGFQTLLGLTPGVGQIPGFQALATGSAQGAAGNNQAINQGPGFSERTGNDFTNDDAIQKLNGLLQEQKLRDNFRVTGRPEGLAPFPTDAGGFRVTTAGTGVSNATDVAREIIKVAAGEGLGGTAAAKEEKVLEPKAVAFETRKALAADGGGTAVAQQRGLQAEADRIKLSVRTPSEELAAVTDNLEKLRDKGLITSEEFRRATGKSKDDYIAAMKSMGDAQRRMADEGKTNLQKLMESWADLSTNVDNASVAASQSIANNLTGAITDIASGTKTASEAFEEMARNIINQITQIVVQLLVQYAISQALGYAVGGIGGGVLGTAVRHDGSSQGEARRRSIDPGVFIGAPRFHAGGQVNRTRQIPGLAANEVPAVLQEGEEVLTQQDASAFRTRIAGADSGTGRGSGSSKQPIQVTILNVQDPEEIKETVAGDDNVLLNMISRNLPKVRKMING